MSQPSCCRRFSTRYFSSLRLMLRAMALFKVWRPPTRFPAALAPQYNHIHTKKVFRILSTRTLTHVSPRRAAARASSSLPRRGRPPKVPKDGDDTPEKEEKKKRGRKSQLVQEQKPFAEECTCMSAHVSHKAPNPALALHGCTAAHIFTAY